MFSPGSRSAPLVLAFSQIPGIECIVIPDERVAGYFALGMAQQLRETVALVCTSGTAVLNLVPAACEAYYQKIPLLLLTADRPEGADKMGENQAIAQDNILFGFNCFEASVNGDAERKNELQAVYNTVAKAVSLTRDMQGPAHINIRLSEPLYKTTDEKLPALKPAKLDKPLTYSILKKNRKKIYKDFSATGRKMIIVGLRDKNAAFNERIKKLSQRKDIIILHESLANINIPGTVWNYDACLSVGNTPVPDIVISMGGQIISKKIRSFLKQAKTHWDIPVGSAPARGWKMFGNILEDWNEHNELEMLDLFLETKEQSDSTFRNDWLKVSRQTEQLSSEYLSGIPFSDMKVFETLVSSYPPKSNIQYGNSTPIRYSNFFKHSYSPFRGLGGVNANRGTSGIDGCVSTAAGAAYVNKGLTISIVGDVSFFYDSNALWNNYLSPNLRIILINNAGGNVFRLIEGPGTVPQFEKFFETTHKLSAKHLAAMHQIPYYYCDSLAGLNKILNTFYKPQKGRPAILEIKTNGKKSAAIYKQYFKFLEKNK